MPLPGISFVPAAVAGSGEVPFTDIIALKDLTQAIVPIGSDANLAIISMYGMTAGGFPWSHTARVGDVSGDIAAGYSGLGGKITVPPAAYPGTSQFTTGDWPANSIVSGQAILQKINDTDRWACHMQLGNRIGGQLTQLYAGMVGNPTAMTGPLVRFSLTPSAAFTGGFLSAQLFKTATRGFANVAPSGGPSLLTGIPDFAKVIFATWQSVHCAPRLRLGTASGIATTGYDSMALLYNVGGASQAPAGSVSGFDAYPGGGTITYGTAVLTLADPVNNVWACSFNGGETTSNTYMFITSGHVTLPGKLDRIELSQASGGNFGPATGWFSYAAIG